MTRAAAFLAAVFLGLSAAASAAESIDCVIKPKALVDLGASDEGTIQEILVERGDRVEAGQPLARLNDDIERLRVQLTALRAQSDVELRSQGTRLKLRQKELERAQQLRERGVAAVTALDDAAIEVALTELALEDAEVQRQLAETEHREAVARLERRTLRSPVDGVIMSVDTAPGEFAHEQVTILKIAEIDPLHVEAFVPARLYGRFRPGDRHTVTPMPPLEGRYQAEVSVVDQVFDAASGTFGVRLELPNPEHTLPAGIRCSLLISGEG